MRRCGLIVTKLKSIFCATGTPIENGITDAMLISKSQRESPFAGLTSQKLFVLISGWLDGSQGDPIF